MTGHNELLMELVESEQWQALKREAEAHTLTYRNAALAEANSEWDFVVKERNAHTARAIPAFLMHIETKVKNNLKKEKGVVDEETLY